MPWVGICPSQIYKNRATLRIRKVGQFVSAVVVVLSHCHKPHSVIKKSKTKDSLLFSNQFESSARVPNFELNIFI